ncbi:MAG: purine-nucleoside phosphorylase [Thermotogota bacterium]|nr:purine-nucleoside phosphorylase [Thermotogota bacterium]
MSILEKQKALKTYVENVRKASRFLNERISNRPEIALILGTGLGEVAETIDIEQTFEYDEIPEFAKSTAPGHKGELKFGTYHGKNLVLLNGRFHYYEGYDMKKVTFPIRVIQELAVEKLIVTNAAGSLNPDFEVGIPMIITDHINFMGDNPLIGPNFEEWGPRFPDMSEPYNKELRDLTLHCTKELGFSIYEGVYVGVAGPNFETPAELRMLRHFGADAVGMSTVPEVIAARHAGIKVLGISAISDRAVADDLEPLTAEEVIEAARKCGRTLSSIILKLISKL